MSDPGKTQEEEHEMISLEAGFRTAAYCVGAQDAVLGLVGLISMLSTMAAEQVSMPMFGQYMEGQEGHRWSPPSELAEEYWRRNIVHDPYRLQLFIVGMLCGTGGLLLCGFLLILGCRFKRTWLIRCWLYPNYFLVVGHASLMIAAAFYAWWAPYALISAPLLSYRLLLVWFVNVYDRTMPEVLKIKWNLKINDNLFAAGGILMGSTGPSNLVVLGEFQEISAAKIRAGCQSQRIEVMNEVGNNLTNVNPAGDTSCQVDDEADKKSEDAEKFDIFESVRDKEWEWTSGEMPEKADEEKYYSATGSEGSDVA